MSASLPFNKHTFTYVATERPVIHIGYGIDDNYARCCASSILSVSQNNPDFQCQFHVLASELTSSSLSQFEEMARRYNLNIHIYDITPDMLPDLPTQVHLPLPTYYRFLLPMVVAEYDPERLLYIDADMICVNPLTELFTCKWEQDEIIAAAPDVQWMHTKRTRVLNLPKHRYFNAGLLVINLPRWNKFMVYDKVLETILANPELYTYLDQDALNVVLQGHVKYLSTSYNAIEYSSKDISKLNIIHFAAHPKPWSIPWGLKDDIPAVYRTLYRSYELQTPFGQLPLVPPRSPKELRFYARLLRQHGHYLQFARYYLQYLWKKL